MSLIMDLPAEIVADILSRPSIRTIAHASCVCKTRHSIISEHYFVNLHLSRSPAGLIIHEQSDENDVFIVGELDDKSDQHDIQLDLVAKFVVGLGWKHGVYMLQGSVNNGLICLWHRETIYICNPVTRESIVLPDHNYYRYLYETNAFVTHGFGFVKGSNQYKVVCLYESDVPSTEGLNMAGCLVYTLGTGMWRHLAHVPFLLRGERIAIFLSGNLHWITIDQKDTPNNEMVCTFDLEKELFQLTASAPRVNNRFGCYRSLGILRGCLCICDSMVDSELTIWVMKDYGTKESWIKEIVIRNRTLHRGIIRPLKVLRDGTILMSFYGLFTYHPVHKSLRIYTDGVRISHDPTVCVPSFMRHICAAMVHVPSFIRLQSFMSEKVSVL